ncbi:MAG: FAD dependent oxidoreductase family protein, partial [Planctomycetota bacterium]
KVKGLIYPVLDPAFPFLGVHFTWMVDGSVECGPNAVFSFKREGYGKTDFSFRDCWDALSYPGTWKMFLKNCRYGLGEYTRAFSKKLFLRQLQRLIPSLIADDIKPGKTGVRAQALGPNGELIDDFKIERQGRSIHVLNAPSPAATASLAIGDYINQIATEFFNLSKRQNENGKKPKVKARKRKSAKNPKYKD